MGVVLKLAGLLSFFTFLFWHWAGNNAEAKCTVTCCVILPFVSGGICCLTMGSIVRWFTRSLRDRGRPARMDVPLLTGMVAGTTLACLMTSTACQTMCRIFQVEMSVAPCKVIVPGLIFAGIASVLVYVFVCAEPRSSGSE